MRVTFHAKSRIRDDAVDVVHGRDDQHISRYYSHAAAATVTSLAQGCARANIGNNAVSQ